MSQAKKGQPQKGVLADHQKVGKTFIPPMMKVGPFKYSHWLGGIIPEFLWIGLLNYFHGEKIGADLAVSLARSATDITGQSPTGAIPKAPMPKFAEPPKEWFAPTRAYTTLSEEQRKEVVKYLTKAQKLEPLQEALYPLAAFYPQFPLKFLFEGNALDENPERLVPLKETIKQLLDKYDRPPVMMLATALYIGFLTNKIKVFEGLALANFPAIEQYPNTEESRVVGASVRATALVMMDFKENSFNWPDYFWNRGLELESCNYREICKKHE